MSAAIIEIDGRHWPLETDEGDLVWADRAVPDCPKCAEPLAVRVDGVRPAIEHPYPFESYVRCTECDWTSPVFRS